MTDPFVYTQQDTFVINASDPCLFLYLSQDFMNSNILLAYFSIFGFCKIFFHDCLMDVLCILTHFFLSVHKQIYLMECAQSQNGLRTFSALCDYTPFFACKSPGQTSGHP